jgi:hypothetical protein
VYSFCDNARIIFSLEALNRFVMASPPMKTMLPLGLLLLLPIVSLWGDSKDDLKFLATGPNTLDANMVEAASGTNTYLANLQTRGSLSAIRTFIGKYHGDGNEPPLGYGASMGAPHSHYQVSLCAAIRWQEAPKFLIGGLRSDLPFTKRGSSYKGADNWQPGSGSTYLPTTPGKLLEWEL